MQNFLGSRKFELFLIGFLLFFISIQAFARKDRVESLERLASVKKAITGHFRNQTLDEHSDRIAKVLVFDMGTSYDLNDEDRGVWAFKAIEALGPLRDQCRNVSIYLVAANDSYTEITESILNGKSFVVKAGEEWKQKVQDQLEKAKGLGFSQVEIGVKGAAVGAIGAAGIATTTSGVVAIAGPIAWGTAAAALSIGKMVEYGAEKSTLKLRAKILAERLIAEGLADEIRVCLRSIEAEKIKKSTHNRSVFNNDMKIESDSSPNTDFHKN